MMLNVACKRQSNLQEQPIEDPFPQQSLNLPMQDKKNVPPLELEPTKKQSNINIFTPISTRGKWTNQALEEAMDVVESRTSSLRKANRHWNISFTFLFDHLGGKTTNKKPRPVGVLTKEENKVVITWILAMQKVGLLMTLQQLKMKVARFTQIRLTPF
jgi:hypothetical protein